MKEAQQSARHEDDDPIVVAAQRCCADPDMLRKPGLIVFKVRGAMLGDAGKPVDASLVVRRSRFEGDYGNICRITLSNSEGVEAMTYAPTACVAEALLAVAPVDAFEALSKVYVEWFKKGEGDE